MRHKKHTAIILAAGQGKRMNSAVQKQYMLIKNKPVLYYALSAFEQSDVDEIILVVGKGETEYCRTEIVERYSFCKVAHIVEGGAERYHSVYEGIKCAADADYVFIHDGARPLVSVDVIHTGMELVHQCRACVAGMPVKDTIKKVDNSAQAVETPERDFLWQVQTPQIFEASLIRKAYNDLFNKMKSQQIKVTDDAMVVESMTDVPVKLYQGGYENIKITTPEDLKIAEILLEKDVDTNIE